MRCRLIILSTILVNVLIACGDPKPVSTGTKAPGLNPITTTPVTNTPTTGGNATTGSTLVTTSCGGCHGDGKIGHKLTKTDVGSIAGATSNANHGGVKTVLTNSTADIEAFLATQ